MRRNLILALAVSSVGSAAFAQLRIVTMNASNYQSNIAQPRAGMNTILQYIGSTISDDPRLAGNSGIAKPIDVLALQEVFTPQTTGAGYAALLNSIYGVNTYSYGTMTGATTGNGTQGIIYNSATVQLLGEAAIGTTNSNGMARQQVRHRIRPVGYSSSVADVYIYNGHWKSSSGDAARRLVEAQTIKADAATLPANSNVIYLGDFNVFSGSESGYAHLLAAGAGQAFDPINAVGNWNDNTSFKNIHTQSPWDSAINPGFNGAGGGMDSRFDQQIVTGNLNDNEGVAYISNSYFTAGNNGSHVLGEPLSTGTGAPPAVLNQLAGILDHLPVSADYQLPAKMNATVTTPAPTAVIVGATANAAVRVQNTAPTTFINGADELDYTITTTGAIGSFSGSAQATTAGNTHNVSFDTSTPGVKNATINVNSASQAVEGGAATLNASTTVLAHAVPSFSTTGPLRILPVDFGVWARGADVTPFEYLVANQADASGFTAALDIDNVTATGDAARFSHGVAFTQVTAGDSKQAFADFDSSAVGLFNASFGIQTSDENLPGATVRGTLTLNVTGRIALGGDANFDNIVNITDFAMLASNFNEGFQTWADGDFNRDGIVNISDFAVLAANFNQSATELPRGSVPEPSVAMSAMASVALLTKRKRKLSS